MAIVRMAGMTLRAARTAPAAMPRVAIRTVATSTAAKGTTAKTSDLILDVFPHASTVREVYHYTSYGLAFGVPLALASSGSVTTAIDLAMGVVVPLHFHIGMRSVLVDYLVHVGVNDPSYQQIAMYALGVLTLTTAAALTRFNLADMGITAAVMRPWKKKAKKADE